MCRALSHLILWHSLAEFIGCVESYHTGQFGTVWKRVHRVCGELLHRAVCHSLAESLYGVWRDFTPHIAAQYGREFLGCVESYHTAKQSGRQLTGRVESYNTTQCGTVWQRFYRVCRELPHCTFGHILVEFIGCVVSYHPHTLP